MPVRINVCLWNLQNYGGGGGGSTQKYGVNSSIRNRFIADYLVSWGVDVLLMMETSVYASADLHDLVNRLNSHYPAAQRDWACSFCGSAIVRGANNPPQNRADVTFMSDARSEGYAIVWRTNQGVFQMLDSLADLSDETWAPAVNPNPPGANTGPLNFTISGRPAGRVAAEGNLFRPLGGYTIANTLPYNNGVVMGNWPDLQMATTGLTNPRRIDWAGARRPAFAVINQANGGAGDSQTLCPLVVYHAPSNQGQADWGVYMSTLSRELYVSNALAGGALDPAVLVHTESVVMGGDYNFEVTNAGWPNSYARYTAAFNQAWTGGAATTETPHHTAADTARRSTVQLLRGDHVTPIVGAPVTDYYRHMIDLVFTRDSADTTMGSTRMDVLQELLNDAGGATFGATLAAVNNHLNAFVAGLAGPNHRIIVAGDGPERRVWSRGVGMVWRPLITGSWGSSFQHWANFRADLVAGQFTSARRAAEYYHMFVSDHLPLITSLSW